MVEDTWFRRDLPVLDAVVAFFEQSAGRSFPRVDDLAEALGMQVDDVARAALALDGEYIELRIATGPPGAWVVSRVYPAARAATGQWPSPESLAARIIAGLEERAEAEADPKQARRLRKVLAVLGGATKDVGTNVLAAVILRSMDLA